MSYGKNAVLFEDDRALDTSDDATWAEIQLACKRRDEVFANWDEQVERLTGPFFRGKGRDAGSSPENPDYEWYVLMRAQIVAGKPASWVSQRRADVGRVESQSVRHGLDSWMVETNYRKMRRKFFADWSLRKSIAYVRRVPAAGTDLGVLDGPRMKPQLLRISPKRYLCDPMAVEHEETRWRGHESITPQPLLLKQAKAALEADPESGWLVDVIEDLKPGGDLAPLRPKRMRDELDRKELHTYEVWYPEEQVEGYAEEAGYHGMICTYAQATTQDEKGKQTAGLVKIREDQPYFGPRTGPYIVSGQEYVPDEIEPLSLFVATEAQVRSFQRRARVMSDAIDSYKNLLFVATTDTSLAKKVHDARHRGVVTVKGVTKDSFFPAEIGGITAQLAAQYQWDSEKIDRLRGISKSKRGDVSASATATAEAIAESGSDARTASLRDVWLEFETEIIRTIAWYMVEDDQSVITLPPEMADQTGTPQIFIGSQDGVRFDDLSIDIEPLSIEYKSSAQRREDAALIAQFVMEIAPLIPQFPWVNWDALISRVGRAYGDPTLRELVNYQLAGQVAGVMLGANLVGAGQTGAQPANEPQVGKNQAGGKSTATTSPGAKPAGGTIGQKAKPAGPPMRGAMAGNKAGAQAGSKAKSKAAA
jgi:hypothetical protein